MFIMHTFFYHGLTGLLLATLLFFSAEAKAQAAPPFTTDRPSQSDASTLVPMGYFQGEAGYTYTEDDTAGATTESHAGPSLLLRYGALDWMELRLAWDGYQSVQTDPGTTVNGVGDGQVSAKVYFWEEAGWLPETTLLAGTSLPFGKDGISSERSDPFLRFLLQYTLPKGFSFGSNIGVTWKTSATASGGKDTNADFIYTALLGYAVNPQVDAFVEFFGALPLDEGEDRHGFDAGFAWRVLPMVQFDLSAGVGLNDAALDLFIAVGISYRLPGMF